MLKEEMKLKPMEYMILQYIRVNPVVAYEDIAYDLNLSSRRISEHVKIMELTNVITATRSPAKKTQYYINPVEDWIVQ